MKNLLTGSARGRPKARVTPIALSHLMAELYNGATSILELSEVSGLCKATVRNYVRELKKRNLVHIAGWGRNSQNCPCTPLYHWAPDKPDARVPKMTTAEKSRKFRKRVKEREVHNRLTLLGQGAGEHPSEEGCEPAPAVDDGPNHGREQVV